MCRRASRRRPESRTKRSCARSSRRCELVGRCLQTDHSGFRPSRSRRARLLRRVRRALRPRNARRAGRGARARLFRGARRTRRSSGSSRTCCATTSAAPTPLYEAQRLSGVARRRAHLPEARGPRAHRRAQDQQRARPGAARASAWASGASIAETGAGQHGVATATVCALLGLECDVYMGAEDMERQSLNVFRMQLLGATVRRVDAGAPHAEGRDQRGDARLGHQRDRQLLPARLGARTASVSADGARVPVGDRPGGARAVPRGDRPAARRDRRVRRRRQQRHGHLRRVRRRSRASG